MKTKGIIYVMCIIVILMAAVIVMQQNEIMKNNVTVELISYSGDKTVDVAVYQQKYGDWLGMDTTQDNHKVKRLNITSYGIILYRDQSAHQTWEQ